MSRVGHGELGACLREERVVDFLKKFVDWRKREPEVVR